VKETSRHNQHAHKKTLKTKLERDKGRQKEGKTSSKGRARLMGRCFSYAKGKKPEKENIGERDKKV